MKLCFVSPGRRSIDILLGDTIKYGGAEAQIANLAAAFVQLGFEIDLIYGDRGNVSSSRVVAGIRCINAMPSWRHPLSLLLFWTALKKSAADLIYARLPDDFLWIIGLFSKLYPRVQFIYAIANDRDCNPWRTYSHKTWFHNPLYALGLRMADIVAIQHEAQAEMVRNYTTGKLIIIPNLIRSVANELRNYDETNIDVIWIAEIRPQKQLSVLLNLAEQLPSLHFIVVGSFSDPLNRSNLEKRMLGLKNLRYLGNQDHESVMRLLIRSKVLVNTSYWEGFPNTMLEAWSLGVPVVSLQTDPGGVIGREGLGLVSKTPSQMVRDIKKLVEEQPLNCAMGKRSQEYVRSAHNIEAVCRAFEQIEPGFQAQKHTEREVTA